MAKDITEYIDDYVKTNYGHTNWGYKSTYSKYELDYTDKEYDTELDNAIIIWYEPIEEEE